MDNASSITQRITALKELHKQGIYEASGMMVGT
jgi:DNA repair photolyase